MHIYLVSTFLFYNLCMFAVYVVDHVNKLFQTALGVFSKTGCGSCKQVVSHSTGCI